MGPGDLIADRFAIEREAGRGGMGTVYRALDRHTGDVVAVKTLRELNPEHARRFVKEAQVLYELRHPRIVKYIAHGRAPNGTLYLAMEWLEGESLLERLNRKPMGVAECFALGLRVAEAIGVAHERGVVHRDLKPGNLFLVDREVERLRLLDFGLARRAATGRELTQTGALLGTPGYMAPEQARGEEDVDQRADVYALGCVLFRCLTRRPVFEGDDILAVLAKLVLDTPPRVSDLCDGVAPPLDDLIDRMLAKSPEDRPASGAEVLEALRACEREVLEAAGSGVSFERAPASEVLPTLTVNEQRVLCLVLARPAAAADDDEATVTLSQSQQQLEETRRAVAPFGGHLERLIDGSLLVTVVRGTPAEQAARAARCAVAMRTVLGHIPIALAAGRGMLSQGMLLGDAIDRAVKLLARRRTDTVRLDKVAATLMGDRIDVRSDADGYYLRGWRGEDEHTRTLLGRATRCVGREREIKNLLATFEECAAEPVARVVLLTAAAGMGKSRVRYELVRRLAERGSVLDADGEERPFDVWIGRGDPMSVGSPFHMLASAIRHAMQVRPGESVDVRRRLLVDRVGRHVGPEQRSRVASFLGELTGTPFPDEHDVQLRAARQDTKLMGDQMRRAWEDWLAAEAADHPVLLVLEDLHWGDLPSVNFLDSALRNLRELPVMVLAVARPDVHELFPSLWSERDLQVLRLSKLTKKASEDLIRQVLGDTVSAATVARVVDQAGGNAFFLEELIRAVAEGKDNALPDTVLAMVQARLEALDGEARRVLRAASVFGKVFWRGGVARLCGADSTDDLDDWLTHLTDAEMIAPSGESRFPGESEHVFRHALVREAAYAALTDPDRVAGHRHAGRWLEAVGEKDALMLAEHFERGGDTERAAGWYRMAAEQALEGDDLSGALCRAESGVRSGASGEALAALRLMQASVHRWRGEFAGMLERGGEALAAVVVGTPRWCNAAAEVVVAARALGETDRLVALAGQLVELAGANVPSAPLATACARGAMQLILAGRLDLADALLGAVAPAEVQLAEADPAAAAWVCHARALAGLYAGDPGAYLQLNERAAEWFLRVGDLRSVCNARVHLGFAYIECGGYRQAEAALRETVAAAERMGLRNVVTSAKNNLGMALARLGKLDEARAVETDAIRESQEQGDARMEGGSRHYLAIIHGVRGELDAAEREALTAVERLEPTPSLRAGAMATLAQVRLLQGRATHALNTARQAIQIFESVGGGEEGESLIRLVYAEALFATGEHAAAAHAISLARSRLYGRAAKIRDEGWRRRFLERVPDNARTLARALEWAGPPAA